MQRNCGSWLSFRVGGLKSTYITELYSDSAFAKYLSRKQGCLQEIAKYYKNNITSPERCKSSKVLKQVNLNSSPSRLWASSCAGLTITLAPAAYTLPSPLCYVSSETRVAGLNKNIHHRNAQ